ncbi:basic blue protein-like [Phragmites australis]|uniref:basic blue protein-like n=1 Tax=Phragmites australis TaxID=29695 RepID=UPI002D781E52|nr:basic blue protein-like [Phragmites australis]
MAFLSATAASILLLVAGAGATEYTVGDSAGWTIGPNYLTWSQKYNFTAGDTLVFDYVVEQHDVYRVTQDAFRTCEPENQTMRVWSSGHDLVNLTVPGDYYFICNVAGHCLGGMKFAVAVAAPPPPPPPTPPPPALPPPPPPATSAGVSSSPRSFVWPDVVRIPCLAVIAASCSLLNRLVV